MYKKITHTIVEEHFDCPEAVDIASEVDTGTPFSMFRAIRPRIERANADKFRSDVNTYFSNLKVQLANVITAMAVGNRDTIADTQTVLFDNASILGDMLKPYYGIEFGEKLSQNIEGLALNLIGLTREASNKVDYSIWKTRTDAVKFNLTKLLSTFNQFWTEDQIAPLIEDLIDELVIFAEQTVAKNNSAIQNSKDKVSALFSVLADEMVNGTIQRYTNSFTA